MAAVLEPVEVRAANLRERIGTDEARVSAIEVEQAQLNEEIRAVTAQAVAANPTGEPSARARTEVKKLTDRHETLMRERTDLENLLPLRHELLAELNAEQEALGVEELRAQRALIDARIRANLSIVAEQFVGMVATWAGEFCSSVEALAQFDFDVRAKGLERVDGLLGSPIEVYPTDVLRLVELLLHGTGIKARDEGPAFNASPGFISACAVQTDGEDIGALVREAELRFQGFPVEKTSWHSAHGEG